MAEGPGFNGRSRKRTQLVRGGGERSRGNRGGGSGRSGRSSPSAPVNTAGLLPAWIGGADLRILRLVPSEQAFYVALGLLVLATACCSGFGATISIGYVLHQPPKGLWFVGIGWVLVLICVERVVLQVPFDRKRWLPLAIAWRVAFSLLLGILLAEPLLLKIYEPEIQEQLSETRAQQIKTAEQTARQEYLPQIHQAQQDLAAIDQERQGLKEKIRQAQLRAACNGEATCRVPVEGCSPICEAYKREAHHARQLLQKSQEPDLQQRQNLRSRLADARTRLRVETADRRETIEEQDGLSAREAALAEVTGDSPAKVWIPRLFLILFDLLPLIAKLTKLFGVAGGGPYEEALAAARIGDGLGARRRRRRAELADHQDEADVGAEKRIADLNAERRVDEAEMGVGYTRSVHEEPIDGYDLSGFAEDMVDHRSLAVEIPPGLRRGGFVGLALLGAFLLANVVWSSMRDIPVADLWLTLPIFVLSAALCAYTGGFRRAPAWAQTATFAVLLAGVVLPIWVVVTHL